MTGDLPKPGVKIIRHNPPLSQDLAANSTTQFDCGNAPGNGKGIDIGISPQTGLGAHITVNAYNRILAAAHGRWFEIFQALAPGLAEAIENNGKHVTCPRHGTKNANGKGDGFRFFGNSHESGNSICNTCGPLNDGIATIAFANNIAYELAAQDVARHLDLDIDPPKTWEEHWQAGRENGYSAYLDRKRVKARRGLRFRDDYVLIPMLTIEGKQVGVQRIYNTLKSWMKGNNKRFCKGSRPNGAFFPIGEMTADTPIFYLAEGYATAATAYEAKQQTTLCCFDSGNMVKVAQAVKGKFPVATLVIAADNDQWNQVNAGLKAAYTVVDAFPDTRVALPDFDGLDTAGKPTDFNDLNAIAGIEAVKRQLGNAAALPQIKRGPGPQADDRNAPGNGLPQRGKPLPENLRHIAASRDLANATILATNIFPEMKWIIPNLLPEGVAILAGAPKAGKSTLARSLALAVAAGGTVFGRIDVSPPSDVLYLALEDNLRRLQAKQAQLTDNPPERLMYGITAPRLDDDLVGWLQKAWLEKVDNPTLIIIDTIAKIKPKTNPKQSLYEQDYAVGEYLLKFAADHHIAILLIHHTRKSQSEDPVEEVSGSFGLTGGVDTCLVLRRQRGTDNSEIFITGRDVEEQTLALRLDNELGLWELLGDAKQAAAGDAQSQIIELLKTESPLQPKDIAKALGKNQNTTRVLVRKLTQRGALIHTPEGYQLTVRENNNSK